MNKKQVVALILLLGGALSVTAASMIYLIKPNTLSTRNSTKIINEAQVNEIAQEYMSKDDKDAWKNMEVTDDDIAEVRESFEGKDVFVLSFTDGTKTLTDKGYKVGDTYVVDGIEHTIKDISKATSGDIDGYCKQQYQMKKYAKQIWEKALKEYSSK